MSTNSYGKDVAMQGIARVIGGLLSFFAIFFFTYVFNEGELGEYNLILAKVNIVTSITTLWLSQSVLRYYDDQKELGNIIVLCYCAR
jgi:O-antigen/teichoic acid export membrane protein